MLLSEPGYKINKHAVIVVYSHKISTLLETDHHKKSLDNDLVWC
jgi:hypothetical protein